MNEKSPPTPSVPTVTRTGDALNGSLTVAELHANNPGRTSAMGKLAIKDLGARYRQIVGLKPGSSSIRTPEMITELLERLMMGQSVASITCLEHMPSNVTLYYWCRDDEQLDADVKWAQGMGQRTLKDLQFDIASAGEFSTGDPRRDELLIKVIDKNASQRNREEFGERMRVDQHVSVAPVVLPAIAINNGADDDTFEPAHPDDDDGA